MMAEEIIKRVGKNATKTQREKWKEYLKTETKEQKFSRVAKPIVYRVLKDLNRLTKMASGNNYTTTFEVVNNISETVKQSADKLVNSYSPDKTQKDILNDAVENIF